MRRRSLLGIHNMENKFDLGDYKLFSSREWPVMKIFSGIWRNREKMERLATLMPTTTFVLRDHPLSEQKSDMLSQPEKTGRRHAREWSKHIDEHLPFISKTRLIVLGINEPTNTKEHLAAVDTYNAAFLEELTDLGLRGGALSLSVGWPDIKPSSKQVDWSVYPLTKAALDDNEEHVLVVHEYWDHRGPEFNYGWWAGRIHKCPWEVEIMILEAGIDMYVSDPGISESGRGWKNQVTADVYFDQLKKYLEMVARDPRITAVTPFTYGIESSEWESFDVRGERAKLLTLFDETDQISVAPLTNTYLPEVRTAAPGSSVVTVPDHYAWGIDISAWNEIESWAQVVESGCKFVYIRGSIGESGLDKDFIENLIEIKKTDLAYGAYHIWKPEKNQAKQAHNLVNLLSKVDYFNGKALPVAIDVELNDMNLPAWQASQKLGLFLDLVQSEWMTWQKSREVLLPLIIYTGAWFWNRWIDTGSGPAIDLAQALYEQTIPLWTAAYVGGEDPWAAATSPGAGPGVTVNSWNGWAIWQFSDQGEVPGISGRVDLNLIRKATLDSFLKGDVLYRPAPSEPTTGSQDDPEKVQLPCIGRLSQHFAENKEKYIHYHTGLDIALPEGSPVRAMADGVVEWVDWFEGYGWCVRIWHPQLQVKTLYAHLFQQSSFKVGQKIKRGDQLGLIGSTGYSTGPHVHFEIRECLEDGSYCGTSINPKACVDPLIWMRRQTGYDYEKDLG